jgi:SAM-dependent methyltransferase
MVEAGELDVNQLDAGVIQGDALALPFADGTFDRVICSEVLEHIPDDQGAMNELARVLRHGGTMAITVPRCVPELINWMLSDEYHNVPGGHIRIYRYRQLTGRLRIAGLTVTGHGFAHGLHAPYWWLKCLVGTTNEKNFFVRQYLKFLTWDIVKGPRFTRVLDTITSPLWGKSLVVYLEKK